MPPCQMNAIALKKNIGVLVPSSQSECVYVIMYKPCPMINVFFLFSCNVEMIDVRIRNITAISK